MTFANEPSRLLVIDDNKAIHDDVRKTLCRQRRTRLDSSASALFGGAAPEAAGPEFVVDSAFQGEEGYRMIIEARNQQRPYRVAFTDVRMPPGLDGIQTTQKVFEVDPEIQVVLCTAYSDYTVSDIVERFRQTDRLLILKKPFDIAEVTLMAKTLSEKWRLTREARQQLEEQSDCIVDLQSVLEMVHESRDRLQHANLSLQDRSSALSEELQARTAQVFHTREVAALALAQLAESRDPETGEHLARMQSYAQLIAERLAADSRYAGVIDEAFLRDFHRSTPLHDIGKVGIPDGVLLKPGRLTRSEFEMMKRHTLIGARALEGATANQDEQNFFTMAADIARFHHERWDGAGYPIGLAGDEIPLAARIAAVADVFDALTSHRVYKDAMAPDDARQILVEGSGSQFDPAVVDAFLDCYESIIESRDSIDLKSAPAHA